MNDGIAFEATVERWLRKSRGAGFTERRTRQRGRVARHGHECDVHATVISDAWRWWAMVTIFWAIACIVFGFTDLDGAVIGTGVAGLLSLGAVVLVFLDPRHVWVECKSGEGSVTREMVWKLVMQVEDVRELVGAQWRPNEAWLVSRAPFDVDALAFARERRVRCFVEQRGDIREVV